MGIDSGASRFVKIETTRGSGGCTSPTISRRRSGRKQGNRGGGRLWAVPARSCRPEQWRGSPSLKAFRAFGGAKSERCSANLSRRRRVRGGEAAWQAKRRRADTGERGGCGLPKFWPGEIDRALWHHEPPACRNGSSEVRLNHGTGVIQMENLAGLKDDLAGTFLGQRWRYLETQNFIKQKATEAGIEVRQVDPRYTSRRCSKCGCIHVAFDREFRDSHRENGKAAQFRCPECQFEADPDYNAARTWPPLTSLSRYRDNVASRTSPPETMGPKTTLFDNSC